MRMEIMETTIKRQELSQDRENETEMMCLH
jgi:hypothetical protein